jgi:hypothetical protein
MPIPHRLRHRHLPPDPDQRGNHLFLPRLGDAQGWDDVPALDEPGDHRDARRAVGFPGVVVIELDNATAHAEEVDPVAELRLVGDELVAGRGVHCRGGGGAVGHGGHVGTVLRGRCLPVTRRGCPIPLENVELGGGVSHGDGSRKAVRQL